MSLIWFKALADLKAESTRGYLGILWWIAEPILYMLAFYLVFAVGFRSGGAEFVPFLLCGVVPWKWFAASIQTGSNVIVANQGLITQVYFHKGLLVATSLTASLLKFAIILSLLLVYLLISGHSPSVSNWLLLCPVVLTQLVLIAGITAFSASIVPFVPDFKLLIENGLMITFFMSGIFYDVAQLPEHAQKILAFNPMVGVIDGYRSVLLGGSWPDLKALSFALAVGGFFLIWGAVRLNQSDRKFAKVIN